MTFRDDARLDPSRIQRRGRSTGAGGMAIGGGIGGIVLLVLAALLGLDLSSLGLGGGTTGSDVSAEDPELQAQYNEECQTGADANENVDCLIAGTINSLDAYWSTAAPAAGVEFSYPGIVLFNDVQSTACGTASSSTGPFYCPPSQTIYIDTTFFDVLVTQFGSSDGPLAQMYVVAHEYAHFIQDLLGVFEIADRTGTGADSDGVKVELMADCLAGVWAANAAATNYILPLTEKEVGDAMSAAESVGDDRIQEATQGQANPDSFTHGTSKERADSFMSGYRSGDPRTCDFFDVMN